MHYKFWQDIPRRYWCRKRFICLAILCLLFYLSHVTPSSSGQNVNSESDAFRQKLIDRGILQRRRQQLEPAFKMLKEKGVPFDPALLVSFDWRSLLEPTLARMPEMSATVRVTGEMKGVYLAGTLLLPERVRIKGDTFILTRDIAPVDENSAINITGDHRLYIFNIGDDRTFQAAARRKTSGDILNINNMKFCMLVGLSPIFRRGAIRCVGGDTYGGTKRNL